MQRVAEIDGGPVCCGTFAQHVGEGDAPEHKDRTLQHATAPVRRALRRFGVATRSPVGDHPGRKPADDQEARYRQDEQLLAQGKTQPHRHRSGDRSDQGAGTP